MTTYHLYSDKGDDTVPVETPCAVPSDLNMVYVLTALQVEVQSYLSGSLGRVTLKDSYWCFERLKPHYYVVPGEGTYSGQRWELEKRMWIEVSDD